MASHERETFDLLKTRIAETVAERLGIRKELRDWSLNDIRDFQADLEAVCKSSVSEKWVYTHFKNVSERLPRIDVLNLLSAYVGCRNWDDFVASHFRADATSTPAALKHTRRWLILALVAGLAVVVWWSIRPEGRALLILVDAYTREPLQPESLSVSLNGMAIRYDGAVEVRPGDTVIAEGPYYKQRVVVVPSKADGSVFAEVFPDDYALMLSFFSRSTADDLDKRRTQLIEAIHPSARIFQSHPQYEGIEMLNRDEFIDRLLLPLNSLRNLEIQHVLYEDDRIFRLQFTQQHDDDENE